MSVSAAGRRLTETPEGRLLLRDWVAFRTICVSWRSRYAPASWLWLSSILHPDEVMWLEQADRLVNHQGLPPCDF